MSSRWTATQAADGNDSFTVALGSGPDIAEVAGADLAPSDSVYLDGGPGTDTLLYNPAGNPISAYDVYGDLLSVPDPSNGSITLESGAAAMVSYRNFEGVPGFTGLAYSAGIPQTINEGQSVTLNGSATAATNSQILSLAWDVNGDGQYGDVVDPAATVGSTATSKPTITWSQLESLGLGQGGTYTIGMQVNTTVGTFYTYTTLTVAPVVNLTLDAAGHGLRGRDIHDQLRTRFRRRGNCHGLYDQLGRRHEFHGCGRRHHGDARL